MQTFSRKSSVFTVGFVLSLLIGVPSFAFAAFVGPQRKPRPIPKPVERERMGETMTEFDDERAADAVEEFYKKIFNSTYSKGAHYTIRCAANGPIYTYGEPLSQSCTLIEIQGGITPIMVRGDQMTISITERQNDPGLNYRATAMLKPASVRTMDYYVKYAVRSTNRGRNDLVFLSGTSPEELKWSTYKSNEYIWGAYVKRNNSKWTITQFHPDKVVFFAPPDSILESGELASYEKNTDYIEERKIELKKAAKEKFDMDLVTHFSTCNGAYYTILQPASQVWHDFAVLRIPRLETQISDEKFEGDADSLTVTARFKITAPSHEVFYAGGRMKNIPLGARGGYEASGLFKVEPLPLPVGVNKGDFSFNTRNLNLRILHSNGRGELNDLAASYPPNCEHMVSREAIGKVNDAIGLKRRDSTRKTY